MKMLTVDQWEKEMREHLKPEDVFVLRRRGKWSGENHQLDGYITLTSVVNWLHWAGFKNKTPMGLVRIVESFDVYSLGYPSGEGYLHAVVFKTTRHDFDPGENIHSLTR